MGWCYNPFKGFPTAAYFILGTEMCERFNYYGMRAILALYLVVELQFSTSTATGIYHAFNFVAYSVPLLGAIAADSYFGKFLVILVLSTVYAAGSIVLAVGATEASIAVVMTIVGLILIAVGTGGIKPCVVAFGADQFPDSPDKEKYLGNYFAFFYFAINLGSLISMNLTPMIRSEVHCVGKDSCYPLAFGLPAALMVTATVLFILGCCFYVMDKPKGNVIFKLIGCVTHAIVNSICHRDKSVKKEHYIDHADDKYDDEFRSDVRRVFSIILIFLPVPIFWALYDQQGSRWTFQATNMNGEIGDTGYSLQPDQIQALNPLMILFLVLFCQLVVYPLCKKCHCLTTPLQRLSTGGMIAVLSFIVAAALELEVEKSYDLGIASGESQLKIANGLDCQLTLSVDATGEKYTKTLEKLEMFTLNHLKVSGTKDLNMELSVPAGCVGDLTTHKEPGLTIKEKTNNYYFITQGPANTFVVTKSESFNTVERSADMRPTIGVMYVNHGTQVIKLKATPAKGDSLTFDMDPGKSGSIKFAPVAATTYDLVIDGTKHLAQKVSSGGIYLIIVKDKDPPRVEIILQPYTCHMLWQVPQYLVISVAEVMFSVGGLEFAYTEAPASMRSLVQATWLLTTSLGNAIVVIIATSQVFERQLFEYLFFAGLMFLDMLVFIVLSVRYKYTNPPELRSEVAT